MITAALEGKLDGVNYENHEVFGLAMPTECPDVDANILNPKNTWSDQNAYDQKANKLAEQFVNNFKQFEEYANESIMAASPKISETA